MAGMRLASLLACTNNGTNVLRYLYDAVGQLTNAVASTNGVAGGATNIWQYDEAGNWLIGDGKFRLYYECIPLSFLCEEAGGASWDGSASGDSVLDRIDNDVDARTPVYLGNKELIDRLKKEMRK